MNFVIIVILIILVIILIIPISKFEDMKKSVYTIAQQLGENYLDIMKENDYFNLKFPAVMFDIDDTLIEQPSGKPIKPIIKLLNKCLRDRLIILIITARDSDYYSETVEELRKNNIKYGFLYLRKHGIDDMRTFKSLIKKKLAEENEITTIMSVGDNTIDVSGEYSGYYLKLPNHNDPNLYHLNSQGISEIVVN
jgi:uncharacterized alpha/beta hydrolase family protein